MNRALSLLLAAVLAAGCIQVGPAGGGTNPGPGPSPVPGPGPSPVPDTQLRRAVAASLVNVPREECVKVYGVFVALASYVEAGSAGVETTGQLLQLTQQTFGNLAWSRGRYPELAETVRVGLNDRFKVPKKMSDARAEVVATFREIAGGCRDAAVLK